MFRTRRVAATLLATLPALLLVGAKPPPAPTSFTPALSYRYGYSELRLANADGSQAALLVRLPPPSGQAGSILQHAIAPLGQRRVAFVDASVFGAKSLRIVSWAQPTPGGPLSVSLDPTPFFTIAGAEITSLDFSPDGSRLAAVSWINGQNQELRFFDVATRSQIGDAIPLAQDGSVLRWRAFDDSLLMRGATGFSVFKDGVQTALFDTGNGGWFDTFNAAAADVAVQSLIGGENYLQRWDGASLSNGAPVLATIAPGHHPSVSCDNARIIFQRGRSDKTIVRTVANGGELTFSTDRTISFPSYPNGCG